MCGIVGFTTTNWPRESRGGAEAIAKIKAMTAALIHRGPDAQRAVVLDGIALGHTRLSIVDLEGGSQPMFDEHSGVGIVFNGEIFNHIELREQLDYPFHTQSDTEVILAAYLKWGMRCVEYFIGQWAFALWDPRSRTLHLSRDRLGVRPLYYTQNNGTFAFASEIKALLAGNWARPVLDPLALKDSLTLWSPVMPRSSVQDVLQLPPGCNASLQHHTLITSRYWDLDLHDERIDTNLTTDTALPLLKELLVDAIRLRLRADVPVAAYLSGGLDSSLITALAQKELKKAGSRLSTFSLSFAQASYDEKHFQQRVANDIGTQHHELYIQNKRVGELLPEAIKFGEQVLVRSAPAPLFDLSGLVRSHNTKVVLTGEGADEFFWGYQIFQETKVRAFWARNPQSRWRHLLLQKIYPYLRLDQQPPSLMREFYGMGIDRPEQPGFSHLLRWAAAARTCRFFSRHFNERTQSHHPIDEVLAGLPERFKHWRPLARCQYIEMQTLLSGYLLAAQGDRMLMGHSVEGRFPFLDHRLVEFAARLADPIKLRVLEEKHILKRLADGLIPDVVRNRPKNPYRAPIAETLTGPDAPSWTHEAFASENLKATDIFDERKVQALRTKLSQRTQPPSEADNMALMAVASVQLLHSHLLQASPPPESVKNAVQVFHTPTALVKE